MPRFTSTEASLYNGISQQSPELRLPSQVTFVEDADLTVSRGIERRPPLQLVSEGDLHYDNQTLVHGIPFNGDTMYLVAIAGSTSTRAHQIIDQDGNEYPIVYSGATQAYLESVDANGSFIPTEALQLTTILDFTFVCNKNVIPAMSTVLEPVNLPIGYLWVSNGVQEVERSITIAGITHTHVKNTNNDTQKIIDYFDTEVNAQVGFSAIKISESILKVVPADNLPFTFTATDSYSDTTMEVSLTEGTKFESLPPRASDAQIMTITPETNTDAEYYLRYDAATKIWSEVSAPEEAAGFDDTTMPHAFIRKEDDIFGTVTGIPLSVYFELETIPYVSRTSGGEDSSPEPSFIGKKIVDTFFFKNRLGFIAGENIILSATDDLFRFWPTTVQEVLDDDPIDVSISSTKNVTLSHVSPFPESLIIIGDNEQFSLGSGGKAFTPENAVLDPTTTYSASSTVPPVSMGSTLYFVAPQSNFAAIREYSVQPDTLITDAADVTGHVSQLIPNNLKQLIAEPNLEYLFLIDTDADSKSIFVYKFFWQGNEKVQSAWQKWNFWFNPIGGFVFNGHLYILGTELFDGVQRTIFTHMNLNDQPESLLDDDGVPYKIAMPNIDRQSIISDEFASYGANDVSLEVTQSDYEMFDIDCITPTLVDRIVGITYEFLNRFISNGKYYLTFGVPYQTTDLGDLECLAVGPYTVGGCEPFEARPLYAANTANANGSSQSFRFLSGASIARGQSQLSMSFWLKPGDISTTQQIFNEATNGDYKFYVTINPTGTVSVNYVEETTAILHTHTSSAILTEDVWQNLFITVDVATNVKIYLNGVEDLSSPTVTNAITNSTINFAYFLNSVQNNAFYQGGAAHFVFWRNRVVSSADVLSVFNAGNPMCFDAIGDNIPGILTDLGPFFPLENHIGFTGQERVDQSTLAFPTLGVQNAVPFTGTGLDVECI